MALSFFFYGTLLDGANNAVARAVHELLEPMGPATVEGALYAVPDPQGWFPALLDGDGAVHGALYAPRSGFADGDLARLDAYEDFDPAAPQSSLYVRCPITATAADGSEGAAQVYRFNQPLPPGSCPIPSGHFRDWLKASGHPQFAGLRDAG